ncbi:neuropeptide FF receptor 2-like isoform X2 [Rhopilema esculentum]|eukprot:gene4481-20724_t
MLQNHSLQPTRSTTRTLLTTVVTAATLGTNNASIITVEVESELSKSIFLVVYVVVAVIGLMGNLITCYVIIRNRHLRKAVHWYTLNMALADLLVILFYVPVEVIKNENNMTWTMGELFCRFNYCVIPTSLVASIYTLVAITIDRHRGVTKPLRWRSDTASIVKISVPVIWLVAIVLSMPLMFVVVAHQFPPGSGVYYCYERWETLQSERVYWTTIFFVQVLIPMCITISLSLHMFKVLKQYRLRDKGYHKKIMRMTITLVGVYTICSSPQHIFFFWHSFGNLTRMKLGLQKSLFKASNLLLILQMALNPVIYGTLGDLKSPFRMIFHRVKYRAVHGFKRKRSQESISNRDVIAESDFLNNGNALHT